MGAYRSICPSFISWAFISDLKSGSGTTAAVGSRGITTPLDVLSGDDIMCIGYCKPAFEISVGSKCRKTSRAVVFPRFGAQLYCSFSDLVVLGEGKECCGRRQ